MSRLDGKVVFTPRAAPQDELQIAYVSHARFARGRILQVLTASPDRVTPRCHHYIDDRCGGCQVQHVNEHAQQTARRAIVHDALRRIGKREVAMPDIVTGMQWGYRTRLTLTLLKRGHGWIGGLHPFDDATRVFALSECPIAHPSLVAAWRAMSPMLSGLPRAESLRVGLRLVSDAAPDISSERIGVVVVIEGGTVWPDTDAWSAAVQRADPTVRAVLWQRDVGSVTDRVAPSRRAVTDLVDDLVPSGSEALEAMAFSQINRDVAEGLHRFVLEQTLAFNPARVIDGYAGIGSLSVSLAEAGVAVTAIESDLVATARAAQRLHGYAAATVVTARMEDGLAAAMPADVVVLNPPRRGIDDRVATVLEHAMARGMRAIVYVSCDPATLARDLTRLPAWRIAALRCFDMFPQTAHVETVCVLVPEVS